MKEIYWFYALGFFAQSLFGARQLVQLFHSEKQGKVASPTLFWQLSLVGSFLFLIYGILQNDFVVIFGQTISYFIYIRNLQLKNDWKSIPATGRTLLFLLPVAAFAWTFHGSQNTLQLLFSKTDFADPIIVLGTVGQLLLNFRFIYQWYYSEKQKSSILPLGFWIISTIASLLIIRYAVHTTPYKAVDPVLLVSPSLGLVVYLRNIYIHFRSRLKTKTAL
jgi:lipid-A-disaccharide synthase-like uncharacterized protein